LRNTIETQPYTAIFVALGLGSVLAGCIVLCDAGSKTLFLAGPLVSEPNGLHWIALQSAPLRVEGLALRALATAPAFWHRGVDSQGTRQVGAGYLWVWVVGAKTVIRLSPSRFMTPPRLEIGADLVRAKHAIQRWDYPTILALAAILLSVAVILGIVYNYTNVRRPINDLAARISTPQQQPFDL
jgi:hypothetical protein